MSTICESGSEHSSVMAWLSMAILPSRSSPGEATSGTLQPMPMSAYGRNPSNAATVAATLCARTTLAPSSQAMSASAAETSSRAEGSSMPYAQPK